MPRMDIRKAVERLRGIQQLVCDEHEPKITLDISDEGATVVVHCDNCGFHAWIHPDQYAELMRYKPQ